MTFFIVFALVINLMGGLTGSSGVDTMGHLGGAIAGLLWGLAFFPRVKTPFGTKMRLFGFVTTGAFFALLLVLLFTK
jgi:membrane associated rhomboid family serine protease